MKKTSLFIILCVIAAMSMAQDGMVTIPSGQTLLFDADEHSAHLYAQDTSLTGYLVLPDSVTYWEYLFEIDALEPYDSVPYRVPVTVIADRAFSHCRHITGITIPATVGLVGIGAFAFCTSLDTIVVDEGNQVYATPDGCNAVIDILAHKLVCGCRRSVIPPTVSRIGNSAFQGISGLRSVVLPDSLEGIDNYAFSHCDSLTSVHIPAWVRNIGSETFSYCWQLDTITVADGNLYFDSRDHCNAIIRRSDNCLVQGCTSTVIPHNVRHIGSKAFCGMRRINRVELPAGLIRLDNFAFQECNSLTSIRIPASVEYLGNNPFVGCTSLDTITVDSLNTWFDSRSSCNAIIAKSDLSLVCGCRASVIPSSVYNIKAYAFKGITGMRRIVLPTQLYSIGNEAFADCSDVETILASAFSAPQLGYLVFQGIGPDIPVHIRRGSLDSYLSEWRYFRNFIEDFPVGVDTIAHLPKDYEIQCHQGQMTVVSDTPQPIYIFDLTGRVIYHHVATTRLSIGLLDIRPAKQGFLLVKVGNHPAEKVLLYE